MPSASEFSFDAFLSHSTRDKEVVRELAHRLRSDGLRIWFDEWEVRPGDSIPAKIEEGLEQSRVLVLCMSAAMFESDWARLESETFRFRDPLNKNRRFVPVRLDSTAVKGSLAQFLYIDWRSGQDEDSYSKLLDACRPIELVPVAEPKAGSAKNFEEYPAEVRGMLREAAKREIAGDVWGADRWYNDATLALADSGLATDPQISELRSQAAVNRQLGQQMRIEYRGAPGASLIKVFEDSGQLVGGATKPEVHEKGLWHQSSLLLVRHHSGRVIYYRRAPEQTYAGKFDFFGGHAADIDDDPTDTARREANEELQLWLNERRLPIAGEWIHQIGKEDQLVWYAPNDREKSTLFAVVLPNHPALQLRLTDEAADGLQLLEIANYGAAWFRDLLQDYRSGAKEFASGAERVFIAYERDAELRAQIDRWFSATPSGAS